MLIPMTISDLFERYHSSADINLWGYPVSVVGPYIMLGDMDLDTKCQLELKISVLRLKLLIPDMTSGLNGYKYVGHMGYYISQGLT